LVVGSWYVVGCWYGGSWYVGMLVVGCWYGGNWYLDDEPCVLLLLSDEPCVLLVVGS
jgi:hypothetical protein